MGMQLIKDKYPNLTKEEEAYIVKKVGNKCNYYYFLEFMDITGGNVKDAYEMFKFDEQLRSALFKYLIRFEIQIKSDFVEYVSKATGSNTFWSEEKFYIFTKEGEFNRLKGKIIESFKNLNISSKTANAYAAVYVMSFGTFVSVFKKINPMYKRDFIKRYTKCLPNHSYELLLKYLLCIRALRNRCAHGTHIVSRSFLNQLYQYNHIKKDEYLSSSMKNMSTFELMLRYLFRTLHCGGEACIEIRKLLQKYEKVYNKYGGKQTVSPTILSKLFS